MRLQYEELLSRTLHAEINGLGEMPRSEMIEEVMRSQEVQNDKLMARLTEQMINLKSEVLDEVRNITIEAHTLPLPTHSIDRSLHLIDFKDNQFLPKELQEDFVSSIPKRDQDFGLDSTHIQNFDDYFDKEDSLHLKGVRSRQMSIHTKLENDR
jgi:hypothetical protein